MDPLYKTNIKHINKNGVQSFFSDDDFFYLRKHIFELAAVEIKSFLSDKKISVLEVGPEGTYDTTSSYPQFSTSGLIKRYCEENGSDYKTIDIIDGCDYKGSVASLQDSLNGKKFDTIILLSVLEHVENIWDVPKSLHESLNDGGVIFINTPMLFKVHGPIPDCWRISKFGYQSLFGKYFELTFDSFPKNQLEKNSFALSLNVKGLKK
jgi:hypothetical protein